MVEKQMKDISQLKELAKRMRLRALKMAFDTEKVGAHLGGGLSAIEILAVLYGNVAKYDVENPTWPERDRILMSKAHCVLAYYTALCEAGLLSENELCEFEKNGGTLAGHPVANLARGIEYSGGSLGMALSVGVGMAIDAKRQNRKNRVFVLLGDGECQEGSVWEAFMSAAQFQCDNLVAIIDKNHLQYDGEPSSVMGYGDIGVILNQMGWFVTVVNGHDVEELNKAFSQQSPGKPHLIVAETVKGKGVSFMENVREWHYSTLTQDQYDQAIQEVNKE